MPARLVLITGTGRCGLISLLDLLNRQPEAKSSLEDPPLLPWEAPPGRDLIGARLARLRKQRGDGLLVDAASFYVRWLGEALAADPDVRVVALTRPREECIASFQRFLDTWNAFPTHHWADRPPEGWLHDPIRTRCFPQYDEPDRTQALRRYWIDCQDRIERAAAAYPGRVLVADMAETLNTEEGQRRVLEFAGVPAESQVVAPGLRVGRAKPAPVRPPAPPRTGNPMDPGRCAVLVPYLGHIHQPCEQGLRELERRGYAVRRVGGFSAIDQGRNQMATDALVDGFEETLWIDSDVEFHPNDVDRLRQHRLPVVCGIYPQKGRKALACNVRPGTPRVVFGREGGLVELQNTGAGFLLIRREVYLAIQHRFRLPLMNERLGTPSVSYFQPILHPVEDWQWYLAEDYAFCERARACGFKILADTRVRLLHHGDYGYSWEDAGVGVERAATFTLNFPPPGTVAPPRNPASPPKVVETDGSTQGVAESGVVPASDVDAAGEAPAS